MKGQMRQRAVYKSTFVFAVWALLGGCAAPVPTRYHTLLVAPADSRAASAPAKFLIDVQPVGVPVQVDQPQLVVRDGAQNMLLLEHERWIAPLADEVRAALSADLTHALATTDVAGQSRPPGASVVRIKLDLHRFDSVAAQYASIDALWSLHLAGNDRPALLCTSRVREAVGQGYDELVRGHQRALATLADRIAQAVPAYVADVKPVCPGE